MERGAGKRGAQSRMSRQPQKSVGSLGRGKGGGEGGEVARVCLKRVAYRYEVCGGGKVGGGA